MAAGQSMWSENQSSRFGKQRERSRWPRCPKPHFSVWFGKSSSGAGATSDRLQRQVGSTRIAILFLCAFTRDLIISIAMNLLSLPDGRIVNLEHLTYAERMGEYLVLHFS